MSPATSKTLDTLGTTGIIVLVAAAIALAVALWAPVPISAMGALLLGPLSVLGAVFTAGWLVARAIVEQLAHQPRPATPDRG